MRRLFLILIFGMACSVQAMDQEVILKLEAEGYVGVPLKRNLVGHLEVEMEINGILGRFILDTGASATVLDRGRSKRFALAEQTGAAMAGGLGKTNMKAEAVTLTIVRIGEFKIKKLSVAVLDFSTVNNAMAQQGIAPHDGVIGADILEVGKAIIDYSAHKLYLKTPKEK